MKWVELNIISPSNFFKPSIENNSLLFSDSKNTFLKMASKSSLRHRDSRTSNRSVNPSRATLYGPGSGRASMTQSRKSVITISDEKNQENSKSRHHKDPREHIQILNDDGFDCKPQPLFDRPSKQESSKKKRKNLDKNGSRNESQATMRSRVYKYPGTIVEQSWHNRGTILGQSWYNLGTILAQSWDNPGTILEQSWHYLGTILVLSWYNPGTFFLNQIKFPMFILKMKNFPIITYAKPRI